MSKEYTKMEVVIGGKPFGETLKTILNLGGLRLQREWSKTELTPVIVDFVKKMYQTEGAVAGVYAGKKGRWEPNAGDYLAPKLDPLSQDTKKILRSSLSGLYSSGISNYKIAKNSKEYLNLSGMAKQFSHTTSKPTERQVISYSRKLRKLSDKKLVELSKSASHRSVGGKNSKHQGFLIVPGERIKQTGDGATRRFDKIHSIKFPGLERYKKNRYDSKSGRKRAVVTYTQRGSKRSTGKMVGVLTGDLKNVVTNEANWNNTVRTKTGNGLLGFFFHLRVKNLPRYTAYVQGYGDYGGIAAEFQTWNPRKKGMTTTYTRPFLPAKIFDESLRKKITHSYLKYFLLHLDSSRQTKIQKKIIFKLTTEYRAKYGGVRSKETLKMVRHGRLSKTTRMDMGGSKRFKPSAADVAAFNASYEDVKRKVKDMKAALGLDAKTKKDLGF